MMELLENDIIKLRALETSDLDLLFSVENNPQFWEISNTLVPYSRKVLSQYLKNAHLDIFEAKQLRLVITLKKNDTVVGMVDLFDFNPHHKRAGIGILILDRYQKNGYGQNALEVFLHYAFVHLDIHQLYANIPDSNKGSLHLFEKLNFSKVGLQKDWLKVNGKYKDVALLQLINPNYT